MAKKNININNLLCFLTTSKNDFPNDVWFDIAFTFYSIDEIKIAKELLSNILKKDNPLRREPEKKKKDLNDVMDFLAEMNSDNRFNKELFVSDS